MKRVLMMVVGVLVALVVAAPVVAAQPNGGAPQDIDEFLAELGQENPVTLDPGAVFGNCDFPIRFEQNGKAKTLELPGGRFVVAFPGLAATLTNLQTGDEVRLNITGASHQSTLDNGDVVTVVTGRNLLGDPEAGFVLAKGRFSFVFDKDGNLVQPLAGKGTLTDICGLLS